MTSQSPNRIGDTKRTIAFAWLPVRLDDGSTAFMKPYHKHQEVKLVLLNRDTDVVSRVAWVVVGRTRIW